MAPYLGACAGRSFETLETAVLLGFLQGLSEWLPVSSEGIVAVAYSQLEGEPLDEAIGYALWLHVGTVPAALIALRREAAILVRDLFAEPLSPSPLLLFLVVSTIVSVGAALPLAYLLDGLSALVGASAMGVVGLLMLATGAFQLTGQERDQRDRTMLAMPDAVLAGLAQGLAVLPGLSRSGLSVAALIGRGIEKREALMLSFLMSIPASIGAAIFAVADSRVVVSAEMIVAALVAFVVGLATIRTLLSFAQRVNLGLFVVLVGATMIGAAALIIVSTGT